MSAKAACQGQSTFPNARAVGERLLDLCQTFADIEPLFVDFALPELLLLSVECRQLTYTAVLSVMQAPMAKQVLTLTPIGGFVPPLRRGHFRNPAAVM